jgi:AcrR family transcriptional regulator
MKSETEQKQMVKRDFKRDTLKARLIAAAKTRIESSGLAILRARDVTEDAGCALGALYNVFEDLDGLILEVNAQTLAVLDADVEAATTGAGDAGQRLRYLGQRYLAFALAHEKLWRALFELRLANERPLPDWILANQAKLLSHIAKPLAQLQPELNEQELMIRTRTMFAAVHGIVSLSLDNRFVSLATDTLPEEIDRFIGLLLKGLKSEVKTQ